MRRTCRKQSMALPSPHLAPSPRRHIVLFLLQAHPVYHLERHFSCPFFLDGVSTLQQAARVGRTPWYVGP
jgi:hypothetical protein